MKGKQSMRIEYIVTAKEGMPPFATIATKKEALRLARQAKAIGLNGWIIKHETRKG